MWTFGILVALCFSLGDPTPSKLISMKPICTPIISNGSSGYIKSLNFPNNYSNELDCMTLITVPESQRVQLIFYSFETELGADIVTIYDGFGPSKKELYDLSGTDPMHKIYKTRSTNVMSIRFQTDIDNTFNGYYGFYQSISPLRQGPILTVCPQNTFSDQFGVLVSTNWPEQYPNEQYCTYKIQLSSDYNSIQIRVNYFYTEEDADIVFIYRGKEASRSNLVKSMSGQYDSEYKVDIQGNDATIVFMSDLDNRFPGFSLTYVGHKNSN